MDPFRQAALTISRQQTTGNAIVAQRHPSITRELGYVAGIDIGGTNLRIALADMNGSVIARSSSSIACVRGSAVAILSLIKDGVQQLLLKVSAKQDALRAVAAGAPGITDVDAGVVIATSYLMGWRNVPLRAMLEDALNTSVMVDNDVNLAAIGEHWMGSAQGVRDFVFIAIGTGVGASIVLQNALFRGAGWAAGEIGYMLVPDTPEVRGKPGEPGALESVIGGEGIKTQWHDIWNHNKTMLPADLTATQIFDHAVAGDPMAQSVLERTARMLSHTIYNIGLLVNCPLFVLGGGVGVHPAVRSTTENMLNRLNMRGQPQLTTSALGVNAQIMGAIREALNVASAQAGFPSENIPPVPFGG